MSDLLRPPSAGNPACPAEPVKAILAGADTAAPATGLRRYALIAVGSASLATGIVGMVVPLLPTTCFLLLAAWCFGRSSPRLHHWMYHNRWFGSYLRDYRSGFGIPRAVKVGSLAILWATIAATAVFAISSPWLRALLIAIAIGVSAHVASQRDARPQIP